LRRYHHEEALRRELLEELGTVKTKIIGPFASWSFLNKSNLLINGTTWLCRYETGELLLSPEHSGFAWRILDQLKNKDIFKKYGLDKAFP
jgi:8-oxo-dGTP pyrophosphatase MutT (NUDIX family)